jgi:hypothetical protein
MFKMLKNPILKVKLSRIYKNNFYLHKMSNLTKWATCRWNIDLKKFQLSGSLKKTYESSNYEYYNHNISKF